MERKHILINGQLIRYFETTGTKTPIIFLHGWRSEGNVWLPAIEALSIEGHPLHALDLPGFGASELPKHSFTVSDYRDIVLGFMDKLNISKAILVGHSFGGRIGIKLASENPNRVEKLVLVDSGGIRRESANLKLKKGIAKIVKPIFKLPGLIRVRKKIYENMGAEDYVSTPMLQETFLNVVREDLQDSLKQITLPTLLIWGDKDGETPLWHGKRMHELVAGSKLEILNGAGHYSFVDGQDAFIKILKAFLSS